MKKYTVIDVEALTNDILEVLKKHGVNEEFYVLQLNQVCSAINYYNENKE